MIDLYQNTFLREIPDNLKKGKRVINIAKAIQKALDKRTEWINKINYTTNLENLDDDILEHLLWEKHIGWTEGLTLATTREEKIRLIDNAIELHRIKGTPAAIELIFRLLNVDCKLEEWFKYGGEPYHFKIFNIVYDKGLNEDTLKLLIVLVNEFKNVRSTLESIQVTMASSNKTYIGTCSLYGEDITIFPWQITNIDTSGTYRIGSAQQAFDTTIIYPKEGVN